MKSCYTIRTGASETPYYLGVQADSTSNGAVIVLRSGTVTDGMRWKIEMVVEDKYCKLTPASGQYGNLVLTGGENCLQQMVYDNEDYSNKWHLHKGKDYTLMYIGLYEGDDQAASSLAIVDAAMREDAQMEGYASTSMSKEELIRCLSSSKVFSCVTHGLKTSIDASSGQLTISDINGLSDDAFTDLKLVYLGACNTGIGKEGADNLVNALYEKGADVVVGFTIEVLSNEMHCWTKAFMTSIAQGNTVGEALVDANAVTLLQCGKDSEILKETSSYSIGSIDTAPCA